MDEALEHMDLVAARWAWRDGLPIVRYENVIVNKMQDSTPDRPIQFIRWLYSSGLDRRMFGYDQMAMFTRRLAALIPLLRMKTRWWFDRDPEHSVVLKRRLWYMNDADLEYTWLEYDNARNYGWAASAVHETAYNRCCVTETVLTAFGLPATTYNHNSGPNTDDD
jgi:hypothetical protein